MNDEDFDLFDLKDVDEVFTSRVVHLKYSQLLSLRGVPSETECAQPPMPSSRGDAHTLS
jgi:hypothetical protein